MSGGTAQVFRFRISLLFVRPEIWREIEVPDDYSFWDLHVAIQDAMGWLDYHLHAFLPEQSADKQEPAIGIPDGEQDQQFLAGWKIPVRDHFRQPGDTMQYEYDFGDGWLHEIRLLAVAPRQAGVRYPRCIAGERACPPEDCGGPPGYEHLLAVLADPKDPEHQDMQDWLREHMGEYHPYAPERFEPQQVEFWNPGERWGIAFGRGTG